MNDLWKVLNENRYARPTATLGHIWVNTAQDAHVKVLEKYKEYFNLTVEQMKMRFLMKDCSD